MGFFNKNNSEENSTPRNPSSVVPFRVLAIGYVGYLCIQMVQTYTKGGPDAPSLGLLIGGIAVLGGGALFLAYLTYKEYKRNKPIYDQAMAELREEAEAARAAEEAAEAEDEEEDLLLEESAEDEE